MAINLGEIQKKNYKNVNGLNIRTRQSTLPKTINYEITPSSIFQQRLDEEKSKLSDLYRKTRETSNRLISEELGNRNIQKTPYMLPTRENFNVSLQTGKTAADLLNQRKENTVTYKQNQLKDAISTVNKANEMQKLAEQQLNQKSNVGQALYNKNLSDVAKEDVNLWDKTGGRVLGAISDILSPFSDEQNYKVKDENGNYVAMPTKNELFQQKVSDSYNTGIGKFLGDAVYQTSKILASTAMNVIIPGSGSALYWTDMFGDNYNNATRDGYSGDKALAYATLGTLSEYLTGKFLGSATKGLTGGKTNEVSKAISKGVKKLINNDKFASLIGSAGSEAAEEFIQEFLDNFNKLATLEGSINPKEYLEVFNKEVLSSALYSAGIGALSGGFVDAATGFKSYDSTLEEFKNDLIQKKNTIKDKTTLNNIDKAINYVNTIQNTNANNNNVNSMLLNKTSAPVIDSTGNMVNPSRYQYTPSNNIKIDNLRKSAIQDFSNSQETQNLISTIEKVVGDKDYNVLFDDTIKNKNGQTINAQITTNKNGEVEIKINPNSNRAGEFLLVHEITHAIEIDSMKKLVLDYASKNPEFNTALESLKQTYGTNDVNSEVLADISGQLFGNQEFINSLSMEQPSIFRRIYNKIIELANKITGNSHEALFIRDLRNKWENAYRTTTTEQAVSNLNNETKFAKQFQDILLRNQNLNSNSMIPIIYSNEKIDATLQNSMRLQNDFRNNVKNGDYENKATGYIASIDSETKGKILRPTGIKTATGTQNYILRMISANNLPALFENAVYIDTLPPMKGKSNNPNELGYHHFVAPINIDGTIYRVLISGKEKQNSKRLYSLNIEVLPQKNGNVPLVNTKSGYQSSGTLPSNISISDLVQSVNIYNYDTGQYQTYNDTDIKYSMQENQNNTQNTNQPTNSLYKDAEIEQKVKSIVTSPAMRRQMYQDIDNYIEENLLSEIDEKLELYGEDFEMIEDIVLDEKNGEEVTVEIQYDKDLDEDGIFFYDGYKIVDYKNDNNFDNNVKNTSNMLKEIKDELEINPIIKKVSYDASDVSDSQYLNIEFNDEAETKISVRLSDHSRPSYQHEGNWYDWNYDIEFINENMTFDKQKILDAINEQIGMLDIGNNQYSQNNQKWQEHLEENYPASGTRTNMQNIKIPTQQDVQRMENSKINLPKPSKVLNPLEISKLTPEDANTTPKIPNLNRNRVNDGVSSFASNIRNKTNMLNEQQKNTILADEEVNYYDKITNEDSLNEAFSRLNENGESETLNWFSKDSEKATAVDVAEGWILLKQYADNNDSDGMVAVAKKLRDMGTKAGQTVQAFNIMARMTPEGMVKYAQSELSEAYDRMVKNKTKKWIDQHQKDFDLTPQETAAIMDIMQNVSTMPDGYDKRVELAKIQKIMTDKLPPERGAGIKSWMRISMLFNPKTQVRNVAGNAIIAPVNSFSDLFASMADRIVGSKTGYRTTGVTNIQNYVKGFIEGLYQSYNDFKQGINTRNIQGNRFEIGEGKSFNNNTAIGKALNRVDSLLSFMLDAGDRMFYEASFTNSVNNQLVLNNTTEVTQEMIDIATQEALSRTWQDNNNYTRFVLNVRKMLNNVNVRGYGLGDVLIPFAKTPANLTKAIVDYSPAGLINTLVKGKRLKNAIETGQFTPQMQHDFVQTLGKASVGTMLYIAGYALAKAGIVSGESDDDKDVRDFMRNTLGVNSYSIKIGNKSFTYDWVQPIAAPFSMMANFVKKQEESENLAEAITSALDTGLNVIFEQSFLTSINDVLSEPGEIGTKLGEQLLDLPARAIPTFMKQIADMVDGTQRTSFEYGKPLESAINSVKSKIPFLSKTLAPSVDSMGREIRKYGGNNNIFNVFLNPANVSTENISESAGEIYRLYQETGDATIMPRVAPYYINKDGEKITMDSSQRAEYQKISGNIIEENVENLLDNSDYKKLSDEDKSSIIKSIVDYSYNKAKKEVLGLEMSSTYNKVNKYTEQGGNVSDYYLHKKEINYALDNPKKYTTITQITDYDNYLEYKDKIDDIRDNADNKKEATINYINTLKMSIPQKAMFIRLYYSSFDDYNEQIVNYINQNVSSIDEKKLILTELGFTIRDGRVYW